MGGPGLTPARWMPAPKTGTCFSAELTIQTRRGRATLVTPVRVSQDRGRSRRNRTACAAATRRERRYVYPPSKITPLLKVRDTHLSRVMGRARRPYRSAYPTAAISRSGTNNLRGESGPQVDGNRRYTLSGRRRQGGGTRLFELTCARRAEIYGVEVGHRGIRHIHTGPVGGYATSMPRLAVSRWHWAEQRRYT